MAPADSKISPSFDDARETFARPAQQAHWARLEALGLDTNSDLERSLGRRVVEGLIEARIVLAKIGGIYEQSDI